MPYDSSKKNTYGSPEKPGSSNVERSRRVCASVAVPVQKISQTPEISAKQVAPKPLTERLKDAVKPEMIQVAPDKWVPTNKDGQVPDISLCRWIKNEKDGTYFPQPFTERFARVDAKLVQLLGLHVRQWATLTRLARANFIEMIQVAPRVTILNLDSWNNHLRRCAENPEMWDPDGPHIKEYKKSL